MSMQTVSAPTRVTSTVIRQHPLHSITAAEIKHASAIISKLVQKDDEKNATQSKLRFKSISQSEPPKALLLSYLDAEARGVPTSERTFVPRYVDLIWSIDNDRNVFDTTVSLDTGTVVSQSRTLPGQHGSLDRYEQHTYVFKIPSSLILLTETRFVAQHPRS